MKMYPILMHVLSKEIKFSIIMCTGETGRVKIQASY